MVNTALFQTTRGQFIPPTTTTNLAGAPAYEMSKQHQLAQYAATGCLNSTYYASAEMQLETVLKLCAENDPKFVAQVAVYCRERGFMKDMPALLAASLASRSADDFPATFKRVIGNGKMLRNFVQIMRSGVTGRKSLGTRTKKLVQNWLTTASEKELLSAYVGNNPSLGDVIKMVHPKPTEPWREAFFAWVIGKEFKAEALPPITTAFQLYKQDRSNPIPDVPFQMLTSLELKDVDWAAIAHTGGWHMVRMNLNTFGRHGVYKLDGMIDVIATRLRDPEAIKKSRVFPYQLMMAYLAAEEDTPHAIREALQGAMEIALENVPTFGMPSVVCVDVSGSMHNSTTGKRGTATSKVRCIDVAGLFGSAILRKNPSSAVIPFSDDVIKCILNPHDTVLTNAQTLANLPAGGTNCSAPLQRLNDVGAKADLIIYVSDNESWMDVSRFHGTAMMNEWEKFRQRNPKAKLVCIDITPNSTSQTLNRKDILNVGGFSDDVFKIIAAFAAGELTPEHWVGEIEAITL